MGTPVDDHAEILDDPAALPWLWRLFLGLSDGSLAVGTPVDDHAKILDDPAALPWL